ncbi:MAG: hypothetical protein ACC682_13820 [Gemmatimonadota bacterium]
MKTRSLRSSVQEVVLIVLGIAIAFSLDAMWDGVVERREERRMLSSLRSEMSVNLDRLRASVDVREAARASADALLQMTGPAAGPQNLTGIDSLMRSMRTALATYDPRTGSTDALVLGGQLSLVSNDSLRLALASWPELLRDLQEDERWAIEQNLAYFAPYPIEGGLLGSRGAAWMPIADSAGSVELLRDPRFARLVENQGRLMDQALRASAGLDDGIQTILRLVDSVLGEQPVEERR